MADVGALVKSGRNYVQAMPKNKLYMYLFLFVALVGGSLIGLSFIGKETYQTLFAGLSPEDASAIVAKLKEQKIPYKLEMGGTTIAVPKDKVYDVRLSLASQNLMPGAGGVGFELFDKASYGMTEFMQNVNYKRAIQGELSRTINQMPEVKASRIHIAIPEKTLYLDKEKDVTASVLLRLKPGKMLSREQVMGIVHMVAGSIEGLKAENVVVIDSSGKILHKSGDKNSVLALSGHQFELQKGVEKKLEDSIQSMLDRFIPSSKSIVRASAELNLRKVETVEEEYAPDKKVVTGEKKLHEKSTNRNLRPGGVPGVASKVPSTSEGRTVVTDGGQRLTESEKDESQISYEVSKTIKKIVEPYGDIKRLSVAVVVDGKYEKVKGQKGEELKYTPRSQSELNDIKNLVSRAVGYDEKRGDKIEILNVPFETDQFSDEKAFIEKEERKELFANLARYGFYALIVFAVFFFLVKPLLTMLKDREKGMPLARPQDLYVKGESAEPRVLAEKPQGALIAGVSNKELVSSIIKEWVKEGA